MSTFTAAPSNSNLNCELGWVTIQTLLRFRWFVKMTSHVLAARVELLTHVKNNYKSRIKFRENERYFTCPLVSAIKISSPYLIGWESTERFGLEKKIQNSLWSFYWKFILLLNNKSRSKCWTHWCCTCRCYFCCSFITRKMRNTSC